MSVMHIEKKTMNDLGFVVKSDVIVRRDGHVVHHLTKELICIIINDEDADKVNKWISRNYGIFPFITKHNTIERGED